MAHAKMRKSTPLGHFFAMPLGYTLMRHLFPIDVLNPQLGQDTDEQRDRNFENAFEILQAKHLPSVPPHPIGHEAQFFFQLLRF